MNKETAQDSKHVEHSRWPAVQKIRRLLDEDPWLLSPIPCASPAEEPQVDESDPEPKPKRRSLSGSGMVPA